MKNIIIIVDINVFNMFLVNMAAVFTIPQKLNDFNLSKNLQSLLKLVSKGEEAKVKNE